MMSHIYYFIAGVATGVALSCISVMAAILVMAWRANRAFRNVMADEEEDA